MNDGADDLSVLYRGFRERYLDYETLTAQLRGWAEALPGLVRLDSLGGTPEGRDLWLLTIGPEPERLRPAVWVDGNLHAVELAGSSVALAIAEDAIRMHLDGALPAGVPEVAGTAAGDVLFYVMPRISPDGAEAILTSGRYVRSVPRDDRPNRQHPRWRAGDVDGDGQAMAMRLEDPAGEYVESDAVPGLMLERRLGDQGPFYRIYPEGFIEHFDGHTLPDTGFLDDNTPDLNRNFPYDWRPEPEQTGAGPFPASEPESRAIVEFATAHPNIFAWFNLHTFGGVYIRPRQDVPDGEMNQSDLALYRQLEAWGEDVGGYPMVSGHAEFTYEPGKPLRGDLTDFAYHQRGCLALVCELWDLFRELDIPRHKPFVDHYTHTTSEELVRLAEWDRSHNAGRVFQPWRQVEHPQLGPVEVGGWDPRVGISNPPFERLPEICARQSAFYFQIAALAPRPELRVLEVRALGDDVHRVEMEATNIGYLPTYVLDSARDRDWNEELTAVVEPGDCRLARDADARRTIGHLAGWGRGLHSGGNSLFHRFSRGTGNRVRFGFTVTGSGTIEVRAGSCRVGWLTCTVAIPAPSA
ncbi:peptidase M14 [Ectothiorhodospiraceae bacterium WFHF3C12]|nr:peptidase M14 [Ectothiorhodospiraceae bacterium WFHF3C12]